MTGLEIAEPLAAAPASAIADAPRFLRRLLRRPLAVVCLAYLLGVVAVAIVAPIALPHVRTEFAGDFLAVRQGPSAEHPLGTDTLGRDVLERLLVGARVTMVGVAQAMLVLVALGIPLGLVAGYFRGRTDRIVGWFGDLTFSMPAIVIIIIVFSVFPNSMTAGMITLGILAAPGLMRVVRSATLPVREELYVAAAQVSGLSRPYIISRHIAPRIAGAVIVQASLLAAAVLLIQSGLAFLNLVVAPPEPSWGGMVADGLTVLEQQPWLIVPPGLTIAVTVLALVAARGRRTRRDHGVVGGSHETCARAQTPRPTCRDAERERQRRAVARGAARDTQSHGLATHWADTHDLARRRLLRRSPRRDSGARGRVGLRQDDDGNVDPSAAARGNWHRAMAGSTSTARTSSSSPRAISGGFADGRSGSSRRSRWSASIPRSESAGRSPRP